MTAATCVPQEIRTNRPNPPVHEDEQTCFPLGARTADPIVSTEEPMEQ